MTSITIIFTITEIRIVEIKAELETFQFSILEETLADCLFVQLEKGRGTITEQS